jgi:NADH-quinone oxidoreductase subunit J
MIEAIFFYAFSAVLVLSAVMVISAKNPIHSVLFLILAFFNAAGLFVMLGAEFIAMILVIVYVGAVAVLFLFVVMMLDINFMELRRGMMQHAPVGATVGGVLLAEFIWMYLGWSSEEGAMGRAAQPIPDAAIAPDPAAIVSNTHALGRVLYTHYVYLFQLAGLILLVAMIGAIVLTLRSRPGVRRQSVDAQVNRDPKDVLKIEKITTGSGVS